MQHLRDVCLTIRQIVETRTNPKLCPEYRAWWLGVLWQHVHHLVAEMIVLDRLLNPHLMTV